MWGEIKTGEPFLQRPALGLVPAVAGDIHTLPVPS